jgi:anti-sigma B factor antagonist
MLSKTSSKYVCNLDPEGYLAGVMGETSPQVDPKPRVTVRRFAAHGVCLESRGELDIAAVPLFRETISAAIAEGHRHVVLDLTAATLLDCACLGAILAEMRPLRAESDAALVLAGATGSVERLLELLEFDRTCSMVPSVEAATTLVLSPNCARVEGWRDDQHRPAPSATDMNPPTRSGGNDELSP